MGFKVEWDDDIDDDDEVGEVVEDDPDGVAVGLHVPRSSAGSVPNDGAGVAFQHISPGGGLGPHGPGQPRHPGSRVCSAR